MPMAWCRRSRLAQAVTIVLLLWTTVDLTNLSLCALENENARPSAAAILASTTFDQALHDQIPPLPARPHVDDCFCCSHCVELQSLAPPLASVSVNRELQPLVLAAPRLFGSRLYHPPLV